MMHNSISEDQNLEVEEEAVDPIYDIIDYLVRCSNISFGNAHRDENDINTMNRIRLAHELFERAPTDFLRQFGKYLSPNHLSYFENLSLYNEDMNFQNCVSDLRLYHSADRTKKRVRNRRYKALQKLQSDTDYFSEKPMMYRNPLLYEQLVGQYLTDEEIRVRDRVDNENLTLLNMILETVDRNEMREKKNEQEIEELEVSKVSLAEQENSSETQQVKEKQWGAFDVPDTTPSFTPETRKQAMISAPERRLLRQEFLQEMFNNFIDGHDTEIDYHSIDNNEQYDDLNQVTQDAEDKYFDSETNDEESLEVHMNFVQQNKINNVGNIQEDPLDVYMQRINKVISK